MSVVAIDIGNTRVGFNVFTAGKAQDPAVRLTHAELDKELAGTLKTQWEKAQHETQEAADEDCGVVIASVVPELTERVEHSVLQYLNTKALVVGRQIKVPVKTMLKEDSGVGQDRLLAVMAAYVNVEKACVIVQVGSALVVDCIDDEGIFRGGSIGPGLAMGAKALHDFAAQLPMVALTPPADESPFGASTNEAINLGLYIGARGAVRELVERYATALGSWPQVVATGGDATVLLEPMGLVDSFVPDLVLQGAALAWEHWRKD